MNNAASIRRRVLVFISFLLRIGKVDLRRSRLLVFWVPVSHKKDFQAKTEGEAYLPYEGDFTVLGRTL